jgi:hypothetical protein
VLYCERSQTGDAWGLWSNKLMDGVRACRSDSLYSFQENIK